jgi:aminopeptidase-like protein
MSHAQYASLAPGEYTLVINSEFIYADLGGGGSLTYAEAVVPGSADESYNEIVLSSYICHAGEMANNECSGLVVLTELVKWWCSEPRRHTLRVLLAPETIGPLVWMSQTRMYGGFEATGLEYLQNHVKAGFTLTCMGGDGGFYLQSAREPNYATRIVESFRPGHVLPWSARVSDERQWCAPGVDLPWATVMKTHPTDPDYRDRYHTSADDLSYVTEDQLAQSVKAMKGILLAIENDKRYLAANYGEPQLSRRGLYDPVSKVGSSGSARKLLNVLSYCDGSSTLQIAEKSGLPIRDVQQVMCTLVDNGLVDEV